MFNWIYDFPAWFGALVLGFSFVAVNTLGVHYIRPLIRPLVAELSDENTLISNAMAVYSVMFGLLLGMLAVITYQNLASSQAVVDSEAASIGALYRNVSSFPEPERTALRDSLKEYTRYVIDEAWPLQQRGLVPKGGVQKVDKIQKQLFSFEPKTDGQRAIFAETLRQFNTFFMFRRARLNAITTSMPPIMWQTIVGGVGICLVMMWLFDASTKAMLVLSGVTAFALGAVIGLVALLDNPFLGELSVAPDAYKLIYNQLMEGS
jgi:hypothetical protein